MSDEVTVKRGRGRPSLNKYPSNYPKQIVCSVTGKTVATSGVQFDKLMKKNAGKTVEQVIAGYVSREGRRIQKEQSKAEKKAQKQAAREAKQAAKANKSTTVA